MYHAFRVGGFYPAFYSLTLFGVTYFACFTYVILIFFFSLILETIKEIGVVVIS